MKLYTKTNPRLKLIAVTLLAALCLPLTTTMSAYALPKNQVIQISHGGCTMWFAHGEAYSGAYAKFKAVAGHCDPGTWIQVGHTRGWGPKCGLWRVPWGTGCSVTAEGSTQSFAGAFTQLLFSQVVMCSNGASPYCSTVRTYNVSP
jgi:hypothetical protein